MFFTFPQMITLVVYVTSILLYAVAFAAASTKDPQPGAAKSRVASTVHAVVSITAVLVWLILYGSDFGFVSDGARALAGVVKKPSDYTFSFFVASSAGYFTSDLLVMFLFPDARDTLSVVHHMILIPAFLMGAVCRVVVPSQFLFLLEEFSTVFLNLRWFYRNDKKVYHNASLLFAATFLLFRMVYGSLVYYYSVMNYVNYSDQVLTTGFQAFQWWVQLSLCSISRVLNIYWSALIIKKMIGSNGKSKRV